MFGNFIYFIIVLLIYATYEPAEAPPLPVIELLFLLVSFTLLFTAVVWARFRQLASRIGLESYLRLDHRYNALVTRSSVGAIVLFAVDIYVLDLTAVTRRVPLLAQLPTLEAVLFLGLFIGYLAIVWGIAHEVYRRLYGDPISRKSFVLSNVSFAVPVLLPWIILSGVADLIRALPFAAPREFLATTQGEILYFLVFLFGVAVVGPYLIQKFWRCRPVPPGPDRQRIEALCRRAELEYADILYWPIFGGRMITAGVMGLARRFRYILVTNALLTVLQPEEVEAVIAHEIGHVKKRHLQFYLFFFVGYMLLSYATFDLIIYSILYLEPLYRFVKGTGFEQATITSALFSAMIIILFLVYFRFIFGYFMRNFERQADTYVFHLFGTARPLISTFQKITLTSGQSPDKPNWHHFSISERVGYLRRCELDRSWIGRHERKVRRSIIVYAVAMVAVAAAGYHLNFGEAGRTLNAHLFEKILLREIDRGEGDGRIHRMLGDLYFSRKDFTGAVRAYERAVDLAPDDPETLNNLAWLYATCEDESFRNPVRAVALAERAAVRKPVAHILDTLAESYYVNGELDAAVAVGRKALAAARQDRAYFEEQLEKFERAARAKSGEAI